MRRNIFSRYEGAFGKYMPRIICFMCILSVLAFSTRCARLASAENGRHISTYSLRQSCQDKKSLLPAVLLSSTEVEIFTTQYSEATEKCCSASSFTVAKCWGLRSPSSSIQKESTTTCHLACSHIWSTRKLHFISCRVRKDGICAELTLLPSNWLETEFIPDYCRGILNRQWQRFWYSCACPLEQKEIGRRVPLLEMTRQVFWWYKLPTIFAPVEYVKARARPSVSGWLNKTTG